MGLHVLACSTFGYLDFGVAVPALVALGSAIAVTMSVPLLALRLALMGLHVLSCYTVTLALPFLRLSLWGLQLLSP